MLRSILSPGPRACPQVNGGKGWNTYPSSHACMFREFRGDWTEEDGSVRSGSIRAWGEWEAEWDLICKFNRPSQSSLYPRYLWCPNYISKDYYERLHNTDPFISSDRFLYSNRKQRKVSGLTHFFRPCCTEFITPRPRRTLFSFAEVKS